MDSFYILNATNEILYEHNSRGRSFRSVVESFVLEKTRRNTSEQEVPPVMALSQALVFHVVSGLNTLVGVASKEIDAAYVFDLLHLIAAVLEDYLGVASSTDLLQNNLDTVEELLCEMLDNGFPMTTEPNAIRDVVLPPSLLNKLMNVAGMQYKHEGQAQLSAIPWRRAKVKYTSNEIFVDILENLQAIIDKEGRLAHSNIKGTVQCTSKLSGTPDVTVILKPVNIVKLPLFHRSVNLETFNKTPGILNFIPPDGTFQIMTYSSELATNVSSPLPYSLQFRPGKASDAFDLVLSTRNGIRDELTIEIPLPASCRHVRLSATKGQHSIMRHIEATSPVLIRWTLGASDGRQSSASTTTLTCAAAPRGIRDATYARLLASMSGSTITGVKVESLKMQRVGDWKPYKGVKYQTKLDLTFRAR